MDATSNIGSDGVSKNIFNGMSGAGVFYCDNNQIFLCGIYSGNNDEVGEKNIIYTSSSDSLVKILKNEFYINTNNFYIAPTKFDTSKNSHNIPRINILNEEFGDQFIGFKTGFLKREIFEDCIQEINNGNSLVIHGQAGVGKSGCVHHIVNYCKENDIVYLGLKLDERTPADSSKLWGEKLGLLGSISECINNISQGEKAIIVLDQ